MAETFHVAPALPATDCPEPCHTLDQYAQNRTILSNYSNITLIFLEGVHNLSYSLTVNTNLIILQPALPNQGQPPKVIGRCDVDNVRTVFIIRALNASIEGLLFENVLLSVVKNDTYNIGGFTVTIRQCVVFTGLSLYFENDVDGSIAIKNSNISGVLISQAKELLIENSMIFKMNEWGFGLYIMEVPNVMIVNSSVSHVNGVGIFAAESNITLRNSHIDSNDFGVVLSNYKDGFFELDHSSFTRNRFSGIWLYFNQGKTIIKDCIFDSNSGTPIVTYQSTVQLSGENVFSNNTAVRGGGLALYQSTVTFDSGSTTRFENNTALEYGGGIYIATDPPILPQILVALENSNTFDDAFQPCFYHGDSFVLPTHVEFSGNNAGFGGMDIFGLTAAS